MSELKNLLDTIDQLKAEKDRVGELDKTAKEQLSQKIRLEWNFHSNVIEGNQLEWGETRSLLLHGLTANGKPLKDHLDMKGHNEALKKLESLAINELEITESLIKEFHQIILVDPYKEYPKVLVGEYKRTDNYLYNAQGERIDFLDKAQVAEELNKLISWTNNMISPPKRKKQKYDMHPLMVATFFHMRFINIHPFDDGNGRICRIFMNIILLQCGFPPVIIKNQDRETYFNAIQKAREEGEEFLAVFLARQLIDSLELYLKAARGESIEEPDDLDKRIALFEKRQEATSEDLEIRLKLTRQTIRQIYDSWARDLFDQLAMVTAKFNKFYDEPNHRLSISIESRGADEQFQSAPNWRNFDDYLTYGQVVKPKNAFEGGTLLYEADENKELHKAEIELQTSYGVYKKGGVKSFGCTYTFRIEFLPRSYKVQISQFDPEAGHQNIKEYTEKLLHVPLQEHEMKEIVAMWGDNLIQHLEHHSSKLEEE